MLLLQRIHITSVGSKSLLRSVALAQTLMVAIWPSEVVYAVAVVVMRISGVTTKVEVASIRTGVVVDSITVVDEEERCLLKPAMVSLRLLETPLNPLTR